MIPVALAGRGCAGASAHGHRARRRRFGLPILQKLDLAQSFQAIIDRAHARTGGAGGGGVEAVCQAQAACASPWPMAARRCRGNLSRWGISRMSSWARRAGSWICRNAGRCRSNNIRFVVCDEVDRMFDIGFRDDIRKILSLCSRRRTRRFLSPRPSPMTSSGWSTSTCTIRRGSLPASKDEQLTNPRGDAVLRGREPWDKQRAIKMLMRQEKPALALIFCRTKRSVDKVAAGLTQDGIAASPIHGDLMQNKRERVMRGFKTGQNSCAGRDRSGLARHRCA